MKHMVDLTWHENMFFDTVLDGHRLIIDASEEKGGSDRGPRPKKLMLLALAGCTAMDVISILRKMKIDPEKFKVIVEADVTAEHPKKYDKMHVIYQFSGKDLPLAKLERAVQLSEEKYCGVSALYREAAELTSEIRIV
jgi:putative redox protein